MTSTRSESDVSVQSSGNGRADVPTMTVVNPATGRPVTEVPSLDRQATLDLVGRARAAQPAWESLGFDGRGALLRDMRTWLVDKRKPVIQALHDENGQTYDDAQL